MFHYDAQPWLGWVQFQLEQEQLMREKGKEHRARAPLVRMLYELGLSPREISENSGVRGEETITHDIRELGGLKAFPGRPTKKDDIFAAVIRRYAEIMAVNDSESDGSESFDATMRDVLAAWLREDMLLEMLHGLEFALERLAVPAYSPDQKRRAHLLGVILGIAVEDPCNEKSWPFTQTKIWWHDMLAAIRSGEETVPKSRTHLLKMLVRRVLAKERSGIMPIWGEQVFAELDQMLLTLTEREQNIIRNRFGIDIDEPMTFRKIAHDIYRNPERIRQIEIKALAKLRHEVLKRQLHILGQPVGDAIKRELEQREKETALKAAYRDAVERHASAEVLASRDLHLLRDLDEFDWSVRTRNCMQNANIVLVGELVQWTERGILRTKNFGRKSLKEVKEVLAELGLSLEMELDPAMKDLILKRREEAMEERRLKGRW